MGLEEVSAPDPSRGRRLVEGLARKRVIARAKKHPSQSAVDTPVEMTSATRRYPHEISAMPHQRAGEIDSSSPIAPSRGN